MKEKSLLSETIYISSDAMRAIAAYVVCIVHMTSPSIHFPEMPHSGLNWWSLLLFESLGKWAVPVFLMLSGALLLDPTKRETTSSFYKKRVSKLFAPLMFWSLLYILLSHFRSASHPTVAHSIGKFFAGEPFYHLYYLFIAVGLYAVAPMVKPFVQSAKPKERIGFAVFCLVLAASSNLLGQFSENFGFHAKPTKHMLDMFVPFFGFFLIGYDLSLIQYSILKKHFLKILAGFLLGWIGTAVLFHWCTQIGGTFYGVAIASNYISFNVMLASICIFLLLRLVFESEKYKSMPERSVFKMAVASISKHSFGLYLCHPIFIAAVRFKLIEPLKFEPYTISIPAMALVFYILGYCTTVVFKRLPILKKVV